MNIDDNSAMFNILPAVPPPNPPGLFLPMGALPPSPLAIGGDPSDAVDVPPVGGASLFFAVFPLICGGSRARDEERERERPLDIPLDISLGQDFDFFLTVFYRTIRRCVVVDVFPVISV
jgi:hypothetical protein